MQKFEAEPFCPDCEAEGRIGLAQELDHEIPHHGNINLFWQEQNLVGRCKKHHTAKTRRGK
jgi:5-methylcytosine-specific restriction protein A